VPECTHGKRPVDQYGQRYCPMVDAHRDRYLVALGADICLAFITARSPASLQCALMANHAGIPVRIHHSGIRSFNVFHREVEYHYGMASRTVSVV